MSAFCKHRATSRKEARTGARRGKGIRQKKRPAPVSRIDLSADFSDRNRTRLTPRPAPSMFWADGTLGRAYWHRAEDAHLRFGLRPPTAILGQLTGAGRPCPVAS